jgi:hypothetical protein
VVGIYAAGVCRTVIGTSTNHAGAGVVLAFKVGTAPDGIAGIGSGAADNDTGAILAFQVGYAVGADTTALRISGTLVCPRACDVLASLGR